MAWAMTFYFAKLEAYGFFKVTLKLIYNYLHGWKCMERKETAGESEWILQFMKRN